MTVYLGQSGSVELKRKSGEPVKFTLERDDVSVLKRRFSVDTDVWSTLITGDQVDMVRADGGNLQLIKDHSYPDWRGYVFVDQLGGIRLYDSFEAAITGQLEKALELVEPTVAKQSIRLQTRNARFSHLARLRSYEFTTERDTVDLTALGEQFKRQYDAGLISGQGRMDAYWEHKYALCQDDCGGAIEFSVYLAQLCIRLTQGADFVGRFFVYQAPNSDSADARYSDSSVWYEAECIVTNVTVSVEAAGFIESSIDFVTTGPIKLFTGKPPSFLLQEDSAYILQEDGSSRLILASD